MNEGKVKNEHYFVLCSWLQAHAIGGEDGNEGLHTFGASHFFTGDWLHIGVRKGKVRILFVETRKRKVSSKVCRPRPANNHPSNPPNQPTSQKKKLLGPRVGSKESTKAQAS
jgi:hypothetical protein